MTRNLLYVFGDVDLINDQDVILCRFPHEEDPAPAREAMQCTEERLETIIEAVDAGRAKAAKGETTMEMVLEMERRAEEIINVFERLKRS